MEHTSDGGYDLHLTEEQAVILSNVLNTEWCRLDDMIVYNGGVALLPKQRKVAAISDTLKALMDNAR